MMAVAVFFTATDVSATHGFTSIEVNQTEAEALLDFRIEEPVKGLEGCIENLKTMRDERLLDPDLSNSDTMKTFGLLNLDACRETEDTVPVSHPSFREGLGVLL